MCVFLIFNFVFSVIVGLYTDTDITLLPIYLYCQAPPSMFCRGCYKNYVDSLIDWVFVVSGHLHYTTYEVKQTLLQKLTNNIPAITDVVAAMGC